MFLDFHLLLRVWDKEMKIRQEGGPPWPHQYGKITQMLCGLLR